MPRPRVSALAALTLAMAALSGCGMEACGPAAGGLILGVGADSTPVENGRLKEKDRVASRPRGQGRKIAVLPRTKAPARGAGES